MEENDTGLPSVMDDHALVAAQTPPWFHYTIGVVLIITNASSVITNGIVLLVFFLRDRKLLTKTNIYIAAICTMSFVMAVLGVPMVVVSCFNKLWLFGLAGCQYYAFLMSFGGFVQILLMLAIAIDRYVYVVRNSFSLHMTSFNIFKFIITCFLVALSFAICPLLGWNQYIYDGVGTDCAIDLVGDENNGRSFVLTLISVFFTLPIIIMGFCYGSIYRKVLQQAKICRRSRLPTTNTNKRQMLKKLSKEKDLIVTIGIIFGLFILSYTPFCVLLLWKILAPDAILHPMVMVIPSMLTKVGGVFTPFVYLRRNIQFQEHVYNMFKCIKNKRVHPTREQSLHINVVSRNSLMNGFETKDKLLKAENEGPSNRVKGNTCTTITLI